MTPKAQEVLAAVPSDALALLCGQLSRARAPMVSLTTNGAKLVGDGRDNGYAERASTLKATLCDLLHSLGHHAALLCSG